MNLENLTHNLKTIKAQLKTAHLVAVSKYSPREDVESAYHLGQLDFGENRLSDLQEKADYFTTQNLLNVRWHFIGNLQTNKVKELFKVPHLFAIHSVSSLKILEEIYKRIDSFEGLDLKIFIQINTSHEDEKSGLETKSEIKEVFDYIKNHPHPKIKLFGLMTMGSIRSLDFQKSAHQSFFELQELKNQLEKDYNLSPLELSMGMSQDYLIALEYEASFIRIGSAIFK